MNRHSPQYQSTNPFPPLSHVYRYGFQAQEQDRELWEGAVSFKYRVEDARLGRFFSVDPLFGDFPYNSCYAFSENRSIDSVELEGREILPGIVYSCSKINTQQKAIGVADNLGIEGTARNVFMTYSGGASPLVPDQSRLSEGLRSFVEPSSTKFAATAAFGPMGLAFMQSVEFVQGKVAQIESISNGGDEGYFALGQLGSEALSGAIGLRTTPNRGLKLNVGNRSSTSTDVSTYRFTQEGETFFHYGFSEHASRFSGGLKPGGFATSVDNLSGKEATSGLSLRHDIFPNAVYTVTPKPGTLVRSNPVAEPKFKQPGGLPE